MLDSRLERALKDFEDIARNRQDAELSAIEAAIFVEECVDATLGDDEIVGMLGSPSTLRELVERKARP